MKALAVFSAVLSVVNGVCFRAQCWPVCLPVTPCAHLRNACASAGFTVQPLALRSTSTKPDVRMMPFPVNRPWVGTWPSSFSTPSYSDDPPSAEAAVNSLTLALQTASCGTYKMTYTKDEAAKEAIERAIEAADAAAVDPEKLRVAREVIASLEALPPIRGLVQGRGPFGDVQIALFGCGRRVKSRACARKKFAVWESHS